MGITLDGRQVQAVSGGGHWGGGMFIHARDQARFGLFTLRRGLWGDEQLLDEAWFDMAATPSAANQTYGFMNFFLNVPNGRGRKGYPNAPSTAYSHRGNGTNLVYVDEENDLVVVARWIPGGGHQRASGPRHRLDRKDGRRRPLNRRRSRRLPAHRRGRSPQAWRGGSWRISIT